jgi:hypothetical protein
VLSGLYVINLGTKELVRVDLAENIDIIGWSGTYLVYTTQVDGESGASPNRFQIKHFLIGNLAGESLVSSNYFGTAIMAGGRVYYAPGQSFKQTEPKEYLYSILPDGSDTREHLDQRAYTIVRSSFDTLTIEAKKKGGSFQTEWFELDLGSQQTAQLDGRPASFEYYRTNGEFVDSPDGALIAWVDNRDGKQVIIVRDQATGQELVLFSSRSITAPIRWVNNNLIIFRSLDDETADYIVSVSGGEAVQLGDVTNVSGYGARYY